MGSANSEDFLEQLSDALPLVSLCVGVLTIILSVVGGFGLIGFEVQLARLMTVDERVFQSATFPLERWLLTAVVVTTIYNLIFYVSFMAQNLHLLTQPQYAARGTSAVMLIAFPLVSVSVVVAIGWFVHNYCASLGRLDSLKAATGVLLVSYVLYDVLLMRTGTLSPRGAHLARAGKNALFRLDLPVLAAFAVLIGFTAAAGGNGMSPDLIAAFTSGAAAFKLLVTVVLFTVISYEDYKSGTSTAATEHEQ